ncbi:MAG: hypothetical protein BWY38_02980 [Ignavibacteria bacterium ADurb.Bin266]|nr:MAG: hypothetical protein BWY38_02980 [Ignavibacteria bacterium ADurb.Bin266]
MRTIIDSNELEERIRLASITSDNNDFSENNLKDISHFFKKYKVNTLIIKKDNSNANNWILKLKNYNIAAKKTVTIDDFSIVFF